MSHQNFQHSHGWRQIHTPRPKWKRSRFRLTPTHIKNALLIALLLVVFASLFTLSVFAFVSRDLPDPDALTERRISQTTKIYDRTGEHLLYEIFGAENRTLVKIQQGFCNDDSSIETGTQGIPLFAIQATIAAEDRKFCEHHGFDVKGLARAFLQNLRGRRVGGSTLTQQLVKNAILSTEKTMTRKAKEFILSLELERRYSKDEILQIYFNEIPYGSTFYGIQAASFNLFDKPVHELTLAEAATLAALPQAPTRYLNDPDRLHARRDWILGSMAEQGFITQQQAEEAQATDTPVAKTINNITAPHFVLYVKEQLEERYGQRQVEEGGLKVITSIDYDLQIAAQEEVTKGVETHGEVRGFNNASLVAMDPKNGHILSMVGSKNYFDDTIDGQVNVALRPRQPGSSFKPMVYAKAFELGYTPNTILWDAQTVFPTVTGDYNPHNYDLKEHGPVTIRKALQRSLNIPAVKTIYLVGVEKALEFAETLGYTTFSDRSRFGLSVGLGGGEVKLLEHVNAYAAFANEGMRHDAVSVLRVEDPQGNVLEEWKQKEGQRVMSENVARMMTNVLTDNTSRSEVFGANNTLELDERPVAAKSGTTNDYHDGWLMGYTSSLVVGVWGGNNNNDAMKRGSGGSNVAGPIWNAFMRRALKDKPIETFTAPEIPQTGKRVLDGKVSGRSVLIDSVSGKLATEYTPASLRRETIFAEYHDILHYVNRDDPLGPQPSDPAQDPYYTPWEQGIQGWIAREEARTGVKITQTAPPTETDDIHIPANFPTVRFESPSENQELMGRDVSLRVNAQSRLGVTRVEFFVDGSYLGTDRSEPFELSARLPNTLSRGFHTLKAVAYDDVQNSSSDTIGIRIAQDPVAGAIEILDPKNSQIIEKTVGSFAVIVSLREPERYASVALFAQSKETGSRTLVERVVSPSSPFVTLSWSLPEVGEWILFAEAPLRDGSETIETPSVLVRVTGGTSGSQELNPFVR